MNAVERQTGCTHSQVLREMLSPDCQIRHKRIAIGWSVVSACYGLLDAGETDMNQQVTHRVVHLSAQYVRARHALESGGFKRCIHFVSSCLGVLVVNPDA